MYNSELDEANALSESIEKNLIKKYNDQKNIDLKLVNQDASKLWEHVCKSEQLSKETCKVIKSIRTQNTYQK